jgi:hypothetical protein
MDRTRGWTFVAIVVMVGTAGPGLQAQTTRGERARIEEITGLQGAYIAEERVFKVTSPRTDVDVSVDGWAMPPFMGLTSWASFLSTPSARTMVMGDLVLFQDEVNPVLSELLESGLEVTALHNHLFFDEPRVYFMHIGGEGALDHMAGGVRRALDKVREVRARAATPANGFGAPALAPKSAITPRTVEDIVGVKGEAKEGMYKVVIGRTTRGACGCDVARELGVNTWAAFAGVDDDAVVDGDFAVLEGELQPVLKALRRAGIDIVAIHHHLTGEAPRILFLHYWGRGRLESLARGVKSALAVQTD